MSNPFDQFDAMPRGLRNNNPLNITGSNWSGQTGSDGAFAQFDTPEAGRAAADQNLQAYYSKHGINTVSGVVSRWAPPHENDTASYIKLVSGKLGVAPDAPLDLTDPAIRSQLLDAMQGHETGVPVQRQANPFDQFDDGAPEPAVTVELPDRPDLGKGATYKRPPQKQPIPQKAQAPQNVPDPTIAQDVASGFLQPFANLWNGVVQDYQTKTDRARNYQPPSLLDAAKQSGGDLLRGLQLAGDVMGLTGAPVQAVVRPIARGINRLDARPYTQDSPFTAPRPMYGEEAQRALEGDINTALSAAQPASKRPNVPMAKPRSLDEMQAADRANWAKVDASGYRFPQKDVNAMAADVRAIVDDAGPELYDSADKVARKIEALAARGELTPAQANRLRSQIREKLMAPGSTEVSVGDAILKRLDAMVDAAPDASGILKDARSSYMQVRKMQDVTDRIESAGLAQSGSGTGGNMNAIRQKVKPLVDPKSPQQAKNFTPQERAAAKKVVKGGPVQNVLRAASAFDPFHGRLGMLLQGGLGWKTGGASLATIPLGMAATVGEKALAAKNLQDLLNVISMGGAKPSVPLPYVAAPSIWSPAGIVGAGEALARLPRTPSPKSEPTPATKARAKQR